METNPNEKSERSDWAEDRTELANERTFGAGMRTGLACVAIAIGLEAVFTDFEPTWVAKVASNLFVAAGIFVFLAANAQAAKSRKQLSTHDASGQSRFRMTLISSLLAATSLVVGVIMWFV